MKLSQLIGYNIKNIFLENSCKEYGAETTDLFIKNQNWAYLLFLNLKFDTDCLYLM